MALQTEDASQGAVVTANEIVNLPLAERRYTDLTLLAPGATTSTDATNTRGTDWFVVNGTRSTMNNYLLDGMDNNNGTHNDQSRSAEIIAPPPDGIAEFQVLTDNPTALYGRAAGAVVIASTKSGTNNHPWSGMGVQPGNRACGEFLAQQSQPRGQRSADVEPARRCDRRPDHQEQAVLLR